MNSNNDLASSQQSLNFAYDNRDRDQNRPKLNNNEIQELKLEKLMLQDQLKKLTDENENKYLAIINENIDDKTRLLKELETLEKVNEGLKQQLGYQSGGQEQNKNQEYNINIVILSYYTLLF